MGSRTKRVLQNMSLSADVAVSFSAPSGVFCPPTPDLSPLPEILTPQKLRRE